MSYLINPYIYTGPSIIQDSLVTYFDAKLYNPLLDGTNWNNQIIGAPNGVLSGATITYSSDNNGYFAFTGTSSQVDVPNDNERFNFPGDFSIVIWIYPTSYSGTYQTIIDTYPGGSTNGWIFTTMNNATQAISWWNSNVWNQSSAAVTLNAWQMLTVSRIGSTIRVYKNTTEILSLSSSASLSGGNLNIARGLTDDYGRFIGRISIVGIYKGKGLTSSEVSQNFELARSRYSI